MLLYYIHVILYDVNIAWTLSGAGERPLRLTRLGKPGQPSAVVKPVLTVQDVCRLLRRSRRHVYRYLKAGRLRPCARILGQWLFSPDEIRAFQKARVPGFLRPLFWDTRLADLSADYHRDFVLARLLESGDRRAMRWAFKTYPKAALLSFLQGRGAAVLSGRALRFWTMLLRGEGTPHRRESWRRAGRHWGGLP